MVNNGVELALSYRSGSRQKLTYILGGNVSYNKNSITNLPNSVQYSYGGSALKGDEYKAIPGALIWLYS